VTRNNKFVLYEVEHWNGWNLNSSMSTHERASLVPAAAVIPALVMYRIIVAVKKFVVGFSTVWRSSLTGCTFSSVCISLASNRKWSADYFERLKCSRRVFGLNTGAWNNGIRFRPSFIGFVG
jgi:hypothetical protein